MQLFQKTGKRGNKGNSGGALKLSLVEKGGGEAHKGAVFSEKAMGSKACLPKRAHSSECERQEAVVRAGWGEGCFESKSWRVCSNKKFMTTQWADEDDGEIDEDDGEKDAQK